MPVLFVVGCSNSAELWLKKAEAQASALIISLNQLSGFSPF
jgi:Tfp pilus assembly protein PilP